MGLGQFLSPYLINGVKNLLNLNVLRAEWRITAVSTLCLVLGATIYIVVTGGNKKTSRA